MSESLVSFALERSLLVQPSESVQSSRKRNRDPSTSEESSSQPRKATIDRQERKEKNYIQEARSFLAAKETRVKDRVRVTNLSQPKKKNKKLIKKLIKLAK